jgi:acyl-coenzyme A synthetase/AMP-(fatty) acid ligase
MVGTAVGSSRAGFQMALSDDRVITGDKRGWAAVRGDAFGVYRATKNAQLIWECVDLINRGGVAAVVPITATDAYLNEIARQVEKFAEERTCCADVDADGILALPTSGSTGSPKLVALPAAGIARFLEWGANYFNFNSMSVSLNLSPWNFDVSLLDTWAVLAAGGTVIAADTTRLHDARYIGDLLVDHNPTFIQVVPSTLDALVNGAGGGFCESVRDVVLTGGAASRSSRAAAASLFPAAMFHNVYGATEVNDCLVQPLSPEQFAESETLPLGSPIPGCEVLLSADSGVTLVGGPADDAEGELLVHTPWMALGYISAGALNPLPGTEVDGYAVLYPMRDRASMTAGRLTYLGRQDRTVKLRGQRINLDEIEHVALQTGLAGMACAWVDESVGAEELHLAYTAPDHRSRAASGLQLRLEMSRHLPSFAMPNQLHPCDSPFPLNGNGKPDLFTIKTRVESE